MRDVVAAGDIGKGFVAPVTAADGFFLPVVGQLRPALNVNVPRLGGAEAFACAGANEYALELRKAVQHFECEPFVRGCRVRSCIGERPESGSGLGNGVQRVEKFALRARQPVEARHQERVAFAERGDHAA